MTINLEHIDELKRRTNVSYQESKEALEVCNGDLLEALIYLEKQNKVNPEQKCSFLAKIKKLIKKGNNTRFVVQKKERIVLDLSVTIAVILTGFASYIVIPALLLALITGHKIKFEGKNGEDLKVNDTLTKISDAVNTAKKKLVEDDQNIATQ